MAVIRCSKGHYYDDTKFAQCPHCGVLPAIEPEKPVKAKRFSFFRKEAPAQQQAAPAAPVSPELSQFSGQGGPAVTGDYDDCTVGLSQMPGGMPKDDDRTLAFDSGAGTGGSGYGDDDNRTIAFGSGAGTGGGGYSDDDNRTIAFGPGTGTGGGGYSDDDNRTIAFGPGAGTGGGGYSDDDNRTIAFGSGAGTGGGGYGDDDNRTIAFSHRPETGGGGYSEDDNRTVAFSHGSTGSINEDDNRTVAFSRNASAGTINEDDNRTVAFSRNVSAGTINEDDNRTVAFSRPDAEKQGSGQRAGSTPPAPAKTAREVRPSAPVKAEPVKMQSAPAETFPLSPAQYVAGWLVCVKGMWKGRDYRLYKGFNRMGNRQGADIPLPEELKETVCALVYDDRSNSFYLVQQSGDSVYLNGSEVKGSVQLNTGDRIKAGEAEFEFIAFCREGRSWDVQ